MDYLINFYLIFKINLLWQPNFHGVKYKYAEQNLNEKRWHADEDEKYEIQLMIECW